MTNWVSKGNTHLHCSAARQPCSPLSSPPALSPPPPLVSPLQTTGAATAKSWILNLLIRRLADLPVAGYSLAKTTVTGAGPAPLNPFCGAIVNNAPLSLQCAGATDVISAIQFASYGTPSGQCGAFAVNASCNAPNSTAIVSAACLGKNGCTVNADTPTFGDPCYGEGRGLAWASRCRLVPSLAPSLSLSPSCSLVLPLAQSPFLFSPIRSRLRLCAPLLARLSALAPRFLARATGLCLWRSPGLKCSLAPLARVFFAAYAPVLASVCFSLRARRLF